MRVTRVGHVGLRVADLGRAVAHATDILGLREVERVGETVYLTCNERHHELVLIGDTKASLDHLALEVEGETDLEEAKARIAREGLPILGERPEEPGIAHALRFAGPGGHVFELFAGMRRDQPAFYNTVGVRPRSFEHVTITAEDPPEMEDFLVRVLGFRVSDYMGKTQMWLRCNSQHHSLAIVTGPNGLHHYAWELEHWGTIAALGDHLRANGQTFLWGPGRHGVGNNLFSYHHDPDGFIVECDTEMLRIDQDYAYEPRDWPDHYLSISQWGAPPPDTFLSSSMPLAPRERRQAVHA